MSTREQVLVIAAMDAMMAELDARDRKAIGNAFVRKYANESARDGAPDLTPVQWRILRMTAEGLTAEECAGKIGIGSKTVFSHKLRIREKLGAANFLHAVTLAHRKGML